VKRTSDARLIICVTWLISFITMWVIFNALLPENEFETKLSQIEQSVSKKDWDKAKKSMVDLNNIYNKNKIVIQANNATEILTTFDLTMGQLEASIQHEQDAALEYIGGLKSSLDFVLKSFSGP
jgi:hypothetical protein